MTRIVLKIVENNMETTIVYIYVSRCIRSLGFNSGFRTCGLGFIGVQGLGFGGLGFRLGV